MYTLNFLLKQAKGVLLILGLLLALTIPTALAQGPGDLDLTFDTDGKVVTAGALGEGMVIQADGKILVAGSNNSPDFILARYNSNGTLDTTFGTGGFISSEFSSPSNEWGEAIALQSDGKIIVAGEYRNGTNTDFAVIRYHSDGSLDSTFGSGGKVITDLGTNQDYAHSVTVQSDGKIVVAGQAQPGTYYNFATVRYNSNGTLDNSFDTDGIVFTAVGSEHSWGFDVTMQADGKIVVVGSSGGGEGDEELSVVRYNSNGSLDSTFDGDGIIVTTVGINDSAGYGVVMQNDGKIVVTGYAEGVTAPSDIMVVRYQSNGTLDTSFDTDGIVMTDIMSRDNWGSELVLQTNGKIVVAGSIYNGSNYDFSVTRYLSNGALDTGFGGTGFVTTHLLSSNDDLSQAIALQKDGKIVVAGHSENSIGLARYGGDPVAAAVGGVAEQFNLTPVQSWSSWGLVVLSGFMLLTSGLLWARRSAK